MFVCTLLLILYFKYSLIGKILLSKLALVPEIICEPWNSGEESLNKQTKCQW